MNTRRKVESAVFHDIEAGYEFGIGLSLRAAITNVTDEDPPFVENESNALRRAALCISVARCAAAITKRD